MDSRTHRIEASVNRQDGAGQAQGGAPWPQAARIGVCLWVGVELGQALSFEGSRLGWLLLLCALLLALRHHGVAFLCWGVLAGSLAAEAGPRNLEQALGTVRLEEGISVAAMVSECTPWQQRSFFLSSMCRLRTVRVADGVVSASVSVAVSLPLQAAVQPRCARLRGSLRTAVEPRNGIRRKRPPLLLLTVKSDRLIDPAICGSGRLLGRASDAVRGLVIKTLTDPSSVSVQPEASDTGRFSRDLAAAMWLGDRDRLAPRVQAGFKNWGLSHLLAVSGLHVGVLMAVGLIGVRTLFGALRVAAAWHVRALELGWLAAAGVWILLAVGVRVSIVRAVLMAGLLLLSFAWRRPSGALGRTGLALCFVALATPASVSGAGFRLSFAATLGVVVLAPRLVAAWDRLPAALSLPLAVSVSAQLATLPWALAIHPAIPIASPIANLICIPAALLTLVMTPIWIGLQAISVDALWLDAVVTQPGRVVEWFALRDPSPLLQPLWGFHPAWSFVWAAGGFAWLLRPRRRLPLAIALALVLWWPADASTRISFLDVGQGDATLLRSGSQTVLVDGGGWRGGSVGARVLTPVVAAERLKRVQVAVLSHGDFDHCAGLLELSWVVAIDELWIGSGEYEGACVDALFQRFSGRTRVLTMRTEYRVGDWTLTTLADGRALESKNDRSLVLRAEANGWATLLPGDLEATGERALLKAITVGVGADLLQVDWLKVGHHGSKTSTTRALLERARPSVAVISAGVRNPYGHPSPVVLDRLGRSGIRVLRTDESGRIDYCPGNDCSR